MSTSAHLTPEVEYALSARIQAGDVTARNELTLAARSYVASVAVKYVQPNADLDDLIQAGLIGCLLAATSFNPSAGHFLPYARPFITGEIITVLRSSGHFTIPEHVYEATIAAAQHGDVADGSMAERIDQVSKLRDSVELDATTNAGDLVHDHIVSAATSPSDAAESAELLRTVVAGIDTLSATQRLIVRCLVLRDGESASRILREELGIDTPETTDALTQARLAEVLSMAQPNVAAAKKAGIARLQNILAPAI
ncbi:MAG: sigA 5 [Microbacteriaceae bacterium]|nr:sigA 5 [Microbacteriaceae bacterium]